MRHCCHLLPQVTPVLLGSEVSREHLDPQEQQERRVLQDLMEFQVNLVIQDLQETLDHLVS